MYVVDVLGYSISLFYLNENINVIKKNNFIGTNLFKRGTYIYLCIVSSITFDHFKPNIKLITASEPFKLPRPNDICIK